MMIFKQKFKYDLQQIKLDGDPYAFIRYGDGERAFCERRKIAAIKPTEGWKYDGSDSNISRKVLESVTADIPGLYLGISCPCCDDNAHRWYLEHMTAPIERITYANLFVNSNHKRFLDKFRAMGPSDTVLVSCKNGDIAVPQNAINPEWDYTPVLEELFKVNKPILVAAGPIKCGLIYDYWTQVPEQNRQIIIDVGSALDPLIHGCATRQYHKPGSATSRRVCRWS